MTVWERTGQATIRRSGPWLACLCAFCGVFAAPAAAASGPSPGVHVDPGSPAGKQYQIPISAARGETSGGGKGPQNGSEPTFGAGVTPQASGQATPQTSTSQSATSSASAGATSSGAGSHQASGRAQHRPFRSGTRGAGSRANKHQHSRRTPRHANLTRAASTRRSDAGGSSTWLALASGGALVLLLGCGCGLALKRLS